MKKNQELGEEQEFHEKFLVTKLGDDKTKFVHIAEFSSADNMYSPRCYADMRIEPNHPMLLANRNQYDCKRTAACPVCCPNDPFVLEQKKENPLNEDSEGWSLAKITGAGKKYHRYAYFSAGVDAVGWYTFCSNHPLKKPKPPLLETPGSDADTCCTCLERVNSYSLVDEEGPSIDGRRQPPIDPSEGCSSAQAVTGGSTSNTNSSEPAWKCTFSTKVNESNDCIVDDDHSDDANNGTGPRKRRKKR